MEASIGTPADRHQRMRELAARLIWWKDPEVAFADQHRFLAQAMTDGSWEDIELIRSFFHDAALRAVLRDPPPGVFDLRSWSYWHARLGVAPVPPLPRRRL